MTSCLNLRDLRGVCYYPELFSPAEVPAELQLIADTGCNAVRVGEGAWAVFQPQPDHFEFSLFDSVLDECERLGLAVIFGTPTYAAPAWVAQQHPDVLRWDFHRRPLAHGSRRVYTYNSRTYRGLCAEITRRLAEHYAGHRAIVGWQIDNEFNCHSSTSYSPEDTREFREWLRRRYGDLERLNAAWGTRFWSQVYSDWQQLDLPAPTPAPQNPHQLLDERRFISDSVIRFCSEQAAILRDANPRWLLTHNGLFDHVDGRQLVRNLDVFGHDQYPSFGRDWHDAAMQLRQARGLSRSFWIIEQQAGAIGQVSYELPCPAPQQIRLWAWQSVAHGARSVFFFPWRTFSFGAEQLCRGVLRHDRREAEFTAEIRQFLGEMSLLPRSFHESEPVRQVALLRSFEDEADLQFVHTGATRGDERRAWSEAADLLHVGLDEVWDDQDWSDYPILIVPALPFCDGERLERLSTRLRSGRTTLLSALGFCKDARGHLCAEDACVQWRQEFGVDISWRTAMRTGQCMEARMEQQCLLFEAEAARIDVHRGSVIASWSDTAHEGLRGEAAVARRENAWWIAGKPTTNAAVSLLRALIEQAGVPLPTRKNPAIEVLHRRADDGSEWLVLLNHGAEATSVCLGQEWGIWSLKQRRVVDGRSETQVDPRQVVLLYREGAGVE